MLSVMQISSACKSAALGLLKNVSSENDPICEKIFSRAANCPINDVTWPNQWCHMTAQGQASPVDKGWYQLTAVLNFGVLKRIQTPLSLFNFILGFWRRWNLYNPLVRQQSLSLSPSLNPCLSSGNHSQRLFQKSIEGFECKINGQALGAALVQLGLVGQQAQTQGIS